jgi:hypothetical protein
MTNLPVEFDYVEAEFSKMSEPLFLVNHPRAVSNIGEDPELEPREDVAGVSSQAGNVHTTVKRCNSVRVRTSPCAAADAATRSIRTHPPSPPTRSRGNPRGQSREEP